MNTDWEIPENYPKLREDTTVFSNTADKVEMAIDLNLTVIKVNKILDEYLGPAPEKKISEFNILNPANEFTDFASQRSRRLTMYGPLVFFSTRGGDAWILHPETSRARCISENGRPLLEGIEPLDIQFEGRFHFGNDGSMIIRYFYWSDMRDRIISDNRYNPITEVKNFIETGVIYPHYAKKSDLREPKGWGDRVFTNFQRYVCDLFRI